MTAIYREMTERQPREEKDFILGGHLADYAYYDMALVIAKVMQIKM